jgi:HTH-type transcriptional regulator, quorum sensing regulator NprR
MNIGNIIKYHRLNQNLTQSVLCNGICSITHLSKIENHNKEADPETISFLLNKLGLTLLEIQGTNDLIGKELDYFLESMIYFDLPSAKDIFTSLQNNERQVNLLENVYTYHIYLYRYYLLLADVQNAEDKKRFLEPFMSVFSQYEKQLYQYCNGILFIQKGKYSQALSIYLSIETEFTLPQMLHGELYYQIALSYGYLKDSSHSATYTNKAVVEFNKQFNYIRTLHAQILLAINYTQLGILQDAHEQFEHLLRNVKMMNRTELLPSVHHNYAMLLEKQENYDQAYVHYKKAQNHSVNSLQYHLSFCNITEILIKQGKYEEALENIQIILKECKTLGMKKYYLIFQYYEFLLNNKPKKAMNYLEKHVFPYFEKNNLSNEIAKYAQLLGDYYAAINKDKAIYYYKKVLSS